MDSARRTFTGGLRRFLIARDEVCRTPWCDAPIRHLDHIIPVADGGDDHRRQRPRPLRGLQLRQGSPRLARPTTTRHRPQVETTTPTGHHYRSRAPAPPGHRIDVFVLAA